MSVIDTLVGFDSAIITITRHAKVPNAGGFSWAETELDPITVRLYNISTHNQREVTLPEGEVKEVSLGLLADGEADIVVSHDSYDTFEHSGRNYRITGVRYYDEVNIAAHTQADCVAV